MEKDNLQVSLPGAGETESLTVLEKQNLGLVTRIDKTEEDKTVVEISATVEKIENTQIAEHNEEESEIIHQRENKFSEDLAQKGEFVSELEIKTLQEEDNVVVELPEIATEPTESKSFGGETDDEVIQRILQDSEEEVDIEDLLDLSSPEDTVPITETTPDNLVSEEKLEEQKISEEKAPNLDHQEQIQEPESDISAQIASLYEEDHHQEDNRPPVPIKTYRWEDVRRAKQQGGYPWTHLYKPPLGPDDEPEVIFRYRSSPKNRRSFEEKLLDSSSTEKIVKTESESLQDFCYPDILEDETVPVVTESIASEVSAVSETSKEEPLVQKRSFKKIFSPKSILKRSFKSDRKKTSIPQVHEAESSEKKVKYCHPLVDKLKTMAEKQLTKTHGKKIKKIPLQESNRITLEEEQKILNLRESPKTRHKGFTSYEERQESDDIVEIVELDESPGEARRRRDEASSHVTPDEIIELPVTSESKDQVFEDQEPKKKMPRRQKEHVYEDIQPTTEDQPVVILTGDTMDPTFLHDIIAPTELRTSLTVQDKQLLEEVEYKRKPLEEFTQSSEEEQKSTTGMLAPICSIDSASSDDERKCTLQAVVEESDVENTVEKVPESAPKDVEKEIERIPEIITNDPENDEPGDLELKSVLKTEASPSLDKRVTFSPSTEDDPDLLKEDIEIDGLNVPVNSRWSKMR